MEYINITQEILVKKLSLHSLWLEDSKKGGQLSIIDSAINDVLISDKNFESSFLVRCTIKNTTFINCNFMRAKFYDTIFDDCSFQNCYMHRVEMNGANFSDTNFTDSHLVKAEMIGAMGQNANFTNCDLGYAYFADSDLRNSIFENANFVWTHFGGAKLYNKRKYHIKSFDKATVIGGVDISPNGDGKIMINTIEELISYISP